MQSKRQRKEVTGLFVNKKVNVSQRYVKQVRLWMHYWEKFGIEKAQQFFLQQYISQRGNVKSHKSHIENVIGGKLDYMRMVVGESNPAYKKLRQRFDILTNVEQHNQEDNRINTNTHRTTKPQPQKLASNIIADSTGIQRINSNTPISQHKKDELLTLIDELINDI